eukprot:TRINITY_DN598_c6_g1_i1.p1 TRINITY_DN598_c6_g1~~TRINITY_DN598_c6_g1_i1.p1  ORF type:complete len:908 (-),score=271.30 TRINITY_DN598_c6_g1_i1:6-2729(-)
MDSVIVEQRISNSELISDSDWELVDQPKKKTKELMKSICLDRVNARLNKRDVSYFPGELLYFPDLQKLPTVVAQGSLCLSVDNLQLIFVSDELPSSSTSKISLLKTSNRDDLFQNDGNKLIFKIPLTMIAKVEPMKQPNYNNVLEITFKNLRVLRFRFGGPQLGEEFIVMIKKQKPQPLAFSLFKNRYLSASQTDAAKQSWNVFSWEKEFHRLDFDPKHWKISKDNSNFSICDSYPSSFIVPSSLDSNTLIDAAKFRSKGRIPVVTWQNSKNKATMSRCSQPLSGFVLWVGKSESDQNVIKSIRENDNRKQSTTLTIFDCRSKVNAYANTYHGAGTENIDDYSDCEISFLNISNIHKMRDSFTSLSYAVSSLAAEPQYFTAQTDWCYHINTILMGASKIVKKLEEGTSVMIHCSDGWDRTSQLCALAQIMMDPYYRTIEGFKVLVEKEFLSFGHKFKQRCGHFDSVSGDFGVSKECSPIFLQFCDCVYQILRQNICAFEFNEKFLITILDAMYNCKYGTFLVDNEHEKIKKKIVETTFSIWTAISDVQNEVSEPFFDAEKYKDSVLYPTVVQFWEGYYLRWKIVGGVGNKDLDTTKKKAMKEEIKELEEQLLRTKAHCESLQKELEVTKNKNKEFEKVIQGVLTSDESGEQRLLLKMVSGPEGKERFESLCEDLQNVRIVEDYHGPEGEYNQGRIKIGLGGKSPKEGRGRGRREAQEDGFEMMGSGSLDSLERGWEEIGSFEEKSNNMNSRGTGNVNTNGNNKKGKRVVVIERLKDDEELENSDVEEIEEIGVKEEEEEEEEEKRREEEEDDFEDAFGFYEECSKGEKKGKKERGESEEEEEEKERRRSKKGELEDALMKLEVVGKDGEPGWTSMVRFGDVLTTMQKWSGSLEWAWVSSGNTGEKKE